MKTAVTFGAVNQNEKHKASVRKAGQRIRSYNALMNWAKNKRRKK